MFKQKQMGAMTASSVDDESKDGDGDVSSKGNDDEEEEGEGDDDEQHGGKRGSESNTASVVSGRVALASAPPVDPLHLHTVSLPQVMASVDVLFPR